MEGYDSPSCPRRSSSAAALDQFFGCATVGSRIVMALPQTEQSSARCLGARRARHRHPHDRVGRGRRTRSTACRPSSSMRTASPTVTLPEGDLPTEFEKATLKKGDGPVVAAGDAVMVQYHGVSWNSGEVFDESWGAAPFSFSTTGGVVQGFADAVIGETVGSQVIAVLPPSAGIRRGRDQRRRPDRSDAGLRDRHPGHPGCARSVEAPAAQVAAPATHPVRLARLTGCVAF